MTNQTDFQLFPLLDQLRTNPTTTPNWDYFVNSTGLKLCYRSFLPKSPPIEKLIIACHGMAAEADYFILFADQIVEQTGTAIYAMDYRGHGRSDGQRGDIKNFQGIIDDFKEFIEFIQPKHPEIPLFILGESMGGIVSLNLVSQNPELFKGIIEFAPAVRVKTSSFSIKELFRLLGGLFIYPFKPSKLIFKTKGNESVGIRVEAHQRFDFENPYHLEAVSLRYILQLNKYLKKAAKSGPSIVVPIIIFQGEGDNQVSAEGVAEFFDTIASEDKELILVPEAYHVLSTDPTFIDWGWKKLRTWLNSH